MPEILDDKSEHCIPFILEQITAHQVKYRQLGEDAPPFFIGLNGVQGAGKTTLVSALSTILSSPPHNLPVLVLSIDDLYLPHSSQLALAQSHPHNPLVQHRGQPSTHDVQLATELFRQLNNRDPDVAVPAYDKSAHNGQGDRVDPAEWEVVNDSSRTVEVVLFEGWCVGFRPLSDAELESKWQAAVQEARRPGYTGQLGKLELESVRFVNEALKGYEVLTERLDTFIHIDAQDTQYVYDWRLQQEAALRASKGRGMTDEQVVRFIDGYYPAYELYTDVLRRGIFTPREGGNEGQEEQGVKGRQMRLVVDKMRKVKEVYRI